MMLEEKHRLEDMYEEYMQEEEHRKEYTKKIQDWCQDVEENPDTLIPSQASDHIVRKSERFLRYRGSALKLLEDAKAWLKAQGEAPSQLAQCVDMWRQIQKQQQTIRNEVLQMLQNDAELEQTQHTRHKHEEWAKEPEPCGCLLYTSPSPRD